MSALFPDTSGFIVPAYNGRSIANIPATIAALLNIPALPGLPPLERALWERPGQVRRVILLILDAAGYELFKQSFNHPAVEYLWPICSVFPSTTVAALASLWTGRAPAGHGLVGTRMWLQDYGVLAQMIALKVALKGTPGQLLDMGLTPEHFLPAPNLPEHLAAFGIATHDLLPHYLANTGLTRMLHRGVAHLYPVANLADAMCRLRHLLESTPGQPLYACVYHPDLDTIAHMGGPAAPAIAADLSVLAFLLQHELIAALSPQAAQDTVLLITADHGQIHTPLDRGIALRDHPVLWRSLLMPPAGEPRAGYLYVRDGHRQHVHDYVARRLAHALDVLDSQTALQAGLWGPGPYHPHLEARLGDLVILLRENYWLVDPLAETPLFLGWHGGLAAQEMQVPFL